MKVITKPRSFWTASKKAFSLCVSPESIIFNPTRNCDIIDEVTIGDIPSSMREPRFDARIIRAQYSGSELSDFIIPNSGV